MCVTRVYLRDVIILKCGKTPITFSLVNIKSNCRILQCNFIRIAGKCTIHNILHFMPKKCRAKRGDVKQLCVFGTCSNDSDWRMILCVCLRIHEAYIVHMNPIDVHYEYDSYSL